MTVHYHVLGQLPPETIAAFYKQLIAKKTPLAYQWIHFDRALNDQFLGLFSNTELRVQWSRDGSRPIQKAFYSEPGHGFRIHKDGIQCKSALNVSLSSNPSDWVRWYDEAYINSISKLAVMDNAIGSSRNINILPYEDVPWVEEYSPKIGEVYILNTDVYHSFKCNGPKPRVILQTKFDGFPDYQTIKHSLMQANFSNLIK